jgi:hypothetical protein
MQGMKVHEGLMKVDSQKNVEITDRRAHVTVSACVFEFVAGDRFH